MQRPSGLHSVDDHSCQGAHIALRVFVHHFLHVVHAALGIALVELCHTVEEDELVADLFARNQLIPPEEYTAFVEAGNYSVAHIVGFASLINIDPGIVLGRLQKDNYVSYSSHTQLKKHYVIE